MRNLLINFLFYFSILALCSTWEFLEHDFFAALKPIRKSIFNRFQALDLYLVSSRIACAALAARSPHFNLSTLWKSAFKFYPVNGSCQVGTIPDRAMVMLRDEFEKGIEVEYDPTVEMIYICASCIIPDRVKSYAIVSLPGLNGELTVDITKNGIGYNKCDSYPGVPSNSLPAFRYNDTFLICGYQSPPVECRQFDLATKNWMSYSETMIEGRTHLRALEIDFNVHWLPGGNNQGSLKSSEYFRDGIFEPGPDLPHAARDICSTRLNHESALIRGMQYNPLNGTMIALKHVYRFDFATERFTKFPDLLTGRANPACGTVTNDKGKMQVIVAGGNIVVGGYYQIASVEYLDLELMKWFQGESLSQQVGGPSSVQIGSYFIMLGGYCDVHFIPECPQLIAPFAWKCSYGGSCPKVSESAIGARNWHSSFLVESRFFNC